MTFPRGGLPPINFAEKSVTEVESSIITAYEAIAQRSLAPGDPIRLFLEAIAVIIVNQRSIIDFAAKQNLLSYAQGLYIDYIGELVGVTRLQPTAAQTTIRFTLSASQGSVFTVPAGTLITTGQITFSIVNALQIPAGQTTGDALAQCTTAGIIGNNLLPGQIKTLVQPIAFVQRAQNITTSNGGAELEDDESFVKRIRLAPSSFSVAGPSDAYTYWALTANPAIIDVAVSTPSPGVVDIRPLLTNGEIPGSEVLQQVYDVLSADNIRPLTDNVHVEAPVAVEFDVDIQYWVRSQDAARSLAIQGSVNDAVADYIAWQKAKIGRDIVPDELIKRVMAAGAKRAVVISPVFTVLDDTEVAQNASLNIAYQGFEDA